MNDQRLATVRTRWAAVGAAVAVTLGAGGLSFVNAAGDDAQSYEAIAPCRLADTRNGADNVGDRAAPLGADETFTLDGWGAHGNCTLPNDTAALALNVTALNATSGTFLQFFPAGGAKPEKGSSLNPAPNQPPTPNAVTVTLSNTGEFSIYNKAGSVDVIIDVVGVFSDVGQFTGAVIADESLTGADIRNSTVRAVDIGDESGITTSFVDEAVTVPGDPGSISSVEIRPPNAGYVTVRAHTNWRQDSAGYDAVQCQITNSATDLDDDAPSTWNTDDSAPAGLVPTPMALERTFAVVAPASLSHQTYRLVCDSLAGSSSMLDTVMSATYHSTSYEPLGLAP